MKRRIARINEQLRRELSEILRFEVRDPRLGQANVTEVDTTADLERARVYLDVPGDDAAKEEAVEGARAAAAFIRGALARRIELRHMPELHFEIDRTLEQARRIERILDEVLPGPEADEAE
ncbi:MAG: 30S ribosome-binding factor RbfA [Longimicrobiales bacterium]